jgi:hypothetical protein
MHRVVCSVFAFLTVAAATWAQGVKETVYSLVLTDTVKAACRQLGLAEPTGRLTLRSDSTFNLKSGELVRSGRFTVSSDTLALAFEDAVLSIGTIADRRVTLAGFTYERSTPVFGPGNWTLRRNGSEDASVRFSFDSSGRFVYAGMQVSSKGSWKIEDDAIVLVWSEIDGEPVEPGFTIRKRIPLGFGFFQIDNYRFEPKL